MAHSVSGYVRCVSMWFNTKFVSVPKTSATILRKSIFFNFFYLYNCLKNSLLAFMLKDRLLFTEICAIFVVYKRETVCSLPACLSPGHFIIPSAYLSPHSSFVVYDIVLCY